MPFIYFPFYCLLQQGDIVPDRFIIYGEEYKKIREAMAETVLSGTPKKLNSALQVRNRKRLPIAVYIHTVDRFSLKFEIVLIVSLS